MMCARWPQCKFNERSCITHGSTPVTIPADLHKWYAPYVGTSTPANTPDEAKHPC